MPPLYEHPIDRGTEPAAVGNDAEADDLMSITGLADALAHERRRLDAVTTILGGWIWETDADHRFVYLSPSVERHAGKPAEWHYGKTREELGEASLRHVDSRDWQEKLAAKATDLKFASPRGQAGSEFQVQSCFRGIVSKAPLDLKCDDEVDPATGRI